MFKGNVPFKKIGNYLPLQPGFELNRDYYIQLKQVRNPISQNIVLFYQFKTRNNSFDSTLAVPDGCIDIIFCCNPQKTSAYVYGTVLESKKISFEAEYIYFGVRYLPEQGIHLMKELINKGIPLEDIISTDPYIVNNIGEAKSFEDRIALFNELVSGSIFEITNVPGLIRYTLERIYSTKGSINMDQLAQETGYSLRYLRKKFDDYIGLSPKLFSEIIRFQNSLNMIISKDIFNWWDIVSENGYYDQAHFINQFRKFSHLTPAKFKEIFAKELMY